jgi:TIR domain
MRRSCQASRERLTNVAYLTRAEALSAAQNRYQYRNLMEADLRESAATSIQTHFDVFLSHSYEDAALIAGIKALLESESISVYVDWLEDPQLDRSRVTRDTADLLRERMRHCGFLLYASSQASVDSKWMPWELGYFDGYRPGRVGILPIVSTPGASFVGQEYLGLYPLIERLAFDYHGRAFGRITTTNAYTGARSGDVLKTLARS